MAVRPRHRFEALLTFDRYGHLLVLKWLVTQASASLTLKTDSGALPIHFAAARGDLDTVKFLVEQKPRYSMVLFVSRGRGTDWQNHNIFA